MNHETSHSDQSQSGNHTNGSQYAALSEQFLTQSRPPLCGPSSIVMVLNSLNVDPRRVSCDAFKKRVAAEGVTMEEFAYLCERNGLFPGPSRLVVSFSRTALGQTGDGHYSPVAAYHQGSDMVLVLDVARFKYPPYWVSVDTLWRAMHARDAVTECARGWFVMSGGDLDQDGDVLPAVGGGDPGRTVIRAAALQYGQDLRRKIVTQGTRTRTSTSREDERRARTTLGFLEELRGLRDKVKALEGALAEKDGAAVQAGSSPSDSNCPVVGGHNLWKMHSRHEEELDCLLTLARGGAALDSLLEHCSEGLKAEVNTLRGFLAAEQQKASE
eukprot:g6734.t1